MSKANTHWTCAQAIAWICTRDADLVEAIKCPESLDVLKVQILRYRRGHKALPVEHAEGELPFRWEPVTGGSFASSDEAIQILARAVLSGAIRTRARDARTGSWGPIGPEEVDELEFRIYPDDPVRPYGFWSRTEGVCRYDELQLSVLDTQGQWPVPDTARLTVVDERIRTRLREITNSGKLKKEDAMKKCQSVTGYTRRAFERAWRKHPADRKIGRGQHGPQRRTSRLKPCAA